MPPRQELLENDIPGDAENPVIAVCDPYSTGCLLVKEAEQRGFSTIAVWAKGGSEELSEHVPKAAGEMNYIAEVREADTLEETVDRIKRACCARSLEAVLPGGENGVDLADALSELMGLASNGTDIPNRRDKKVQQDLVRKHGLRAIREACGSTFSDVEGYLQNETYPLVLKPLDSAGSDGVKVVDSFEEAKEHFENLIGSQMVNGPICEAVLCQEQLVGTEYIVDQVTCNGHHKVMMIWRYDKRKVPANGADFVYYGIIPVDIDSREAQTMIPYMRGVLDAMGMKFGATHGEVIMTEDGPCLVEINCRVNGGDGNWQPLALKLTGYSQVDAAVDAYLDQDNFHRLPDTPPPFKAHGQEVKLVSYSVGKVKSSPGLEEIKKMDSFFQMESGVGIGSQVEKTIDLETALGSVILMHNDKETLNRDHDRIRELESSNRLVEFEENLSTAET